MNTYLKQQLDFLSQSYSDLWKNYIYVRTSPSIRKWDYIVITASDEQQAQMYRLQIQKRLESGFLPIGCTYLCIPDPEGKRVGSGGATLAAVHTIANQCGMEELEKQRILLIHSGGDSKRIPQYSVCGKLFSPVPRLLPDGNTSTLFDEFFIQLSSMPERIGGGMMVLSGDVLLLYNPLQVALENKGATAVSIKASVKKGSQHGVFLTDQNGQVIEFLHKLSIDALEQKGAVNEHGNVDIDTGVVWLSGELISTLAKIVETNERYEQFVSEGVRLSFYGDFLYPLAKGATEESYYAQSAEHLLNTELHACRQELWQQLHGAPLYATKPSPARFLHFGTTEELRHLTTALVDTYQQFGWGRHILTLTESQDSGWASQSSLIGSNVQIGDESYIENSFLDNQTRIGRRCVVAAFDGKGQSIQIPDDTALHQIQLQDGTLCIRIFGVGDNPKESKWFGKSIDYYLQTFGIPPSTIFDTADTSLWCARLFPVCTSKQDAIIWTQIILDWVHTGQLRSELRQKWLNTDRTSLALRSHIADTQALLSWQNRLETEIRAALFCRAIERDAPHEEAIVHLSSDTTRLKEQLIQVLAITVALPVKTKIRIYKSISLLLSDDVVLDNKTNNEYEDLCYQTLSDEVVKHYRSPIADYKIAPQPAGKEVVVALPVRINWGGGWSDTPPYCFDFGGTVLNAALTVKGKNPVRAKARILGKPIVRCISEDGNICKEYSEIEPLLSYSDPKDPFALHKAVLVACGILKSDSGGLQEQLARLGNGIELSTKVTIPKGSGLGASSILAGAGVKAITELLDIPTDDETICYLALCVEQLMNTGGGWQDQVGGVVPGIKMIQTQPGLHQVFSINTLKMSEDTFHELQRRFVLVYTGQRRLARNILREVVGKVLIRESRTMEILREIQHLAVLMAFELERGHITEFAQLLNKHWELSVELDSGTTNTCIDYIFSSCAEYIDGRFIGGAGGGGFLVMILKEDKTKEELAARLQEMFQESGVAVWESNIILSF